MRARRRATFLLSTLLLLAGPPALAARRPVAPDQYCAPVAARTGLFGQTLSQSFQPRAKTVAAVDALLVSVRTQKILPRMRLVAQRSLPEGNAAQTAVLGQSQSFVTLVAFQPTWVRLPLPTPVSVAGIGPLADQMAVEVVLPAGDDSVLWLRCDGYIGGTGYVDTDPGSVADRDTGTAVAAGLGLGLAFREYSTKP